MGLAAISSERRIRLVHTEADGGGHEAVTPLSLDLKGGRLFIKGGEMRELDSIAKVEAL